MLLTCPECELPVSDKAQSCPHCGYPMKENITQKPNVRKKHMRLPNGFGQITELKNQNLRNRFRASVTVGKTPEGKPICKLLKPVAYFPTYNEAYLALAEYNKNPYDLSEKTTMQELYDRWIEAYRKTLKSDSSVKVAQSVWRYCSSLYAMRVCDVRVRHIKGCIEEGYLEENGKKKYPSACMKKSMKSYFNLMFDYAVEYELTDKNYARDFSISRDIIQEKEVKTRSHMAFTQEEMQKIIENVNTVEYADILLIQCYSGWRPQELGLIRIEDVDLKNGTMTGGIKTDAGKDRIVPIHSGIYPLVKKRYDEAVALGSEYLFNCTDERAHKGDIQLSYSKYQKRFYKIRDRLGLDPLHRAHDGRKHFVTAAKKSGLDEYAIKYIVGHSISDLTERVYTEREISWLKSEMEKIKIGC